MSAPLVRHVARYICPHCRRSHGKRAAAERHIKRCYRNPAARSCKTCALWEPGESGDGQPYGYPGCPESCGAGIKLEVGTMPIGCGSWEPSE